MRAAHCCRQCEQRIHVVNALLALPASSMHADARIIAGINALLALLPASSCRQLVVSIGERCRVRFPSCQRNICVVYNYVVLDCRGIAPRIAPAEPVVNRANARATRCCRQCEQSIRYCHQCEQHIAAANKSNALMSSMWAARSYRQCVARIDAIRMRAAHHCCWQCRALSLFTHKYARTASS